MTKAKKTNAPPATPPPPLTRKAVEKTFLSFLTHEVERLDKTCQEWQTRIAEATDAARLVYDLDWSLTLFESATKRAVYTEALSALKDNPEVSMESLAEYALKEALSKGKFLQKSSSAVSNLVSGHVSAAWAALAEDLRNWSALLKKADDFYGKPVA